MRPALPASDTWQNVKIKMITRQVATILRLARLQQGRELHDHCTLLSAHFLAIVILLAHTLTVVMRG